MKNFIIIFFIYVFIMGNLGFCVQQSSQILSASLPQVLEIEKIIVETVEYNRDEPLPNMRIKKTNNADPNDTFLELSPVKVQIHTNSSTPIIISANFKELKHTAGSFDFNPANLSVSPQSYTINDPYDHVITDIFTPFVDVKPGTVTGQYRGSILFTLGAI